MKNQDQHRFFNHRTIGIKQKLIKLLLITIYNIHVHQLLPKRSQFNLNHLVKFIHLLHVLEVLQFILLLIIIPKVQNIFYLLLHNLVTLNKQYVDHDQDLEHEVLFVRILKVEQLHNIVHVVLHVVNLQIFMYNLHHHPPKNNLKVTINFYYNLYIIFSR